MRLKALAAALVLTATVSSQAPAACTSGLYYTVLPNDTCGSIVTRFWRGSYTLFKSTNGGMSCVTSDLYTGQKLCRP